MNLLSFSLLRRANLARLPLFKNSKGEPAHSRADGSDWAPAEWFCAFLGEVGEFAKERVEFEEGRIDFREYERRAAKELADVACYHDLLSVRALDTVALCSRTNARHSPAQQVLTIMASFGMYCEARKKYVRGDLSADDFADRFRILLGQTIREMTELWEIEVAAESAAWPGKRTKGFGHPDHVAISPAHAHPEGVDLGTAVTEKFNEVSQRVGALVSINDDGLRALKFEDGGAVEL